MIKTKGNRDRGHRDSVSKRYEVFWPVLTGCSVKGIVSSKSDNKVEHIHILHPADYYGKTSIILNKIKL